MNEHVDMSAGAIHGVVAVADAAAAHFAQQEPRIRAALLRGLAQGLEAQRETLVPLADRETGLGTARLNGELDRTAFQLRGFATEVESATPFAMVDDAAVPGTPPAGRPRLSKVRVPLGVVAMFSASNFPFAFSVLGGDTASALAAGCPVVVKAHPGHPALSRAVHRLAQQVLAGLSLPPGVIGLVEGASVATGVALVRHPLVEAVAFTGSVRGGLALQAECHARARPIPFYGELGSVNPVLVMPRAAAEQGAALASALAQSIALGCGQFCTSPGVIVAFDDAASEAFVRALASALSPLAPHGMLTPAIRAGFDAGVQRLAGAAHVKRLLDGLAAADVPPRPALFECDAATFLAEPELREEVFGPAAAVVRVASIEQAEAVLLAIGGSLTATVWGADQDSADTRRVVRAAQKIAGRVLFSGVPTGVAVTHAQHHGGPYPSSTQPFTSSVGYAAMDRFLRPVALQDAPAWLLAREGVPC